MISYSYVKESIRNVKKYMKYEEMMLNKNIYDIDYSLNNPFLQLNTDLSWKLQMNVQKNKSNYFRT